ARSSPARSTARRASSTGTSRIAEGLRVMMVRPCATADEMRAAFAPIWHYFGQSEPSADAIKHFARVLEVQRVHAAWDGDKVVGGSGAFALDLTVPGGQVKAAGVIVVGVLSTHCRCGILRAMMRSQIDAARARGEPVGGLCPSDGGIDGRCGVGMASQAAEIDMPRGHAAPFARIDVDAQVRRVALAAAEPLVARAT